MENMPTLEEISQVVDMDEYASRYTEIFDNFSDNWFDNYCAYRDLFIDLILKGIASEEELDLQRVFELLDEAEKIHFVDPGYIDNLRQTIKNKLHTEISKEEVKASQETIDKYIRPSKILTGMKYYDRYFSGLLVELFNTVDKNYELRRVYHLSSVIFKQSDSTVKSSYKKINEINWGGRF
tara:strand:- start:14527 stop:15069 length:543 start_codon:yes stop_codon:yes gene_type:complete